MAWVAVNHGPRIIFWLLIGKIAIYPLFLYVYIVQRYSDEFFYYRNLGIRRRWLLGGCCAIDLLFCYLLLKISVLFFYEPL